MARRVYNVVAVTGKYTDSTGKEKSRYKDIGVVIEGKHGLMLKLEAMPIGWDGFAYLNEPKTDEASAPARAPAARAPSPPSAPMDDFSDDDIPF